MYCSTGRHVTNELDVLEEIRVHFEKIYNKNNPDYPQTSILTDDFIGDISIPKLDVEEVEFFEAGISEEEVAAALKQMNRNSTPGNDGIPTEIYQVFWQHIKVPLLNCYEFSFQNGILPLSERVGVINLIHKGKDLSPDNLDNWRPISLCNSDYKILSKVLSKRLDTVIHKLVGKQQTGFMKGRSVSNIHRTVDDILDVQRQKKLTGILLAIDFRKAFDSLNMNCLLKCLERFGFGPNFIKWIKVLNTERLSCVKNGGYVSGTFPMKNGVRQGCPISPQLFILTVEILAQTIIQDGDIKGIKPYIGQEAIKIGQYADDTTLFLGNVNELTAVIQHLKRFSVFSGLFLNIDKSYAMTTDGTPINTNGLQIKFKENIKILGIYFSNVRSASDLELNWNSRIDNVLKIFGRWSRRDLSLFGKIHIIKTFGMSQFSFLMQSIILPAQVLDDINRIFFRFLWRKKFTNKRAYEKVKRKVLFNDYEEGGLRMADVRRFQDSVLLSWAERLLTKEKQSWASIANESFKNLGGLNVFRGKIASRDLKGSDMIPSKFWLSVLCKWLDYSKTDGNRRVTINDPIFNNNAITYRGETLFQPWCIKKGIITIRDITIESRILTLHEFKEKVGIYPRVTLDYNIISNALRIPLRGCFSAATEGCYFRDNLIGNLGRRFFYEAIKNIETPLCVGLWERKFGVTVNKSHWENVHRLKETRLKTISWKILHNIYPTNILLFKMKLSNSQNCKYCDTIDYIEHFFFHCEKVRPLWQRIQTEIQLKLEISVELSETSVLLGVISIPGLSKKGIELINQVLAIGKMVVSKFKFGIKRNIIEIYETDCVLRNVWAGYT